MAMELVEAVKLASGGKHVLESIAWGGAPSSARLPDEIQGKLGKEVVPSQGYGATETSSMATGICGEDYLLRKCFLFSIFKPDPRRANALPWSEFLLSSSRSPPSLHRSYHRRSPYLRHNTQDRRRARPRSPHRFGWRDSGARREPNLRVLAQREGYKGGVYC